MGTVSPAIEGRLAFINDTVAPVVTITTPVAKVYRESDDLTMAFDVTDAGSGVRSVEADLDGVQ